MKVNRRQFVKTSLLSSMGAGIAANNAFGLEGLSIEPGASDIIKMPVHELSDLIYKKKVSSFEVVSAFVKRIEAVNPALNAVVVFRPEEALKEARKADEDLSKGKRQGVLHGIPCTIKDSFDTQGIVSAGERWAGKISFPEKTQPRYSD